MLIAPEGDTRRRRHAHTDCVLGRARERAAAAQEDWQRTQPRPPSLWARLRAPRLSVLAPAYCAERCTRSGSTRMITRCSPGWR